MTDENPSLNTIGRLAWQRPTLVRMGAADAEGTVMMTMRPDATRPMRMMGS